MDSCKAQAQTILETWFQKAANWQKDLFTLVWSSSLSEEQILERATKLIAQEYLSENYRLSPNLSFPLDINFSDTKDPPVMLTSIANIKGVGALAPQNALTFSEGLTVVYGENGCGKSSYVRILKALENPANSDAVIGNVFEIGSVAAEATVTFSVDGDPKVVTWSKNSKRRYPLQIYDTTAAKQFVDKENEVVYEPKVLSAITRMAKVYERVSSAYDVQTRETAQKITPIPQGLQNHPIVREFTMLSSLRDEDRFTQKYYWNTDLDTELSAIVAGLKENDPQKAALEKTTQRDIIRNHGFTILKLLQFVTDSQCSDFLEKRKKQITSKATADALIKASQNHSLLNGFGTDSWKSMWMYASEYINRIEGSTGIPVTQTGRCALCQQELDTDAKVRLQTFREFAESKAMVEADAALRNFGISVKTLQENIENKINIAELEMTLTSGSISEGNRQTILGFYKSIVDRCKWLLSYSDDCTTELPPIQSKDEIASVFKDIVAKMNTEITVLQETAKNKESQVNRMKDLIAIHWAIDNASTKKQLIALSTVISKCKTNALTSLKKELSKLLITDEYVSRFQQEMHFLDSKGQIKVELVAKAPKKGKSYHQISLRGAQSAGNHKNGEILSEGEFRVVSLAAFLADLSSWNRVMPFIFDDPITSLDHKFEARVAKRLIKLSMDRQVIVFTHRLAFAQLLEAGAAEFNAEAIQVGSTEHAKITHIELRNHPLGHPSSPNYVNNMAMTSAITNLLREDVSRIKKAQNSGDFATADMSIQSLCARFRNVIEYGIETTLLSNVVSRFKRNISTLALPRLSAITPADIELLDSMMTKYSYYDHSHSVEAPMPLPKIEDVEADLNTMLDWAKQFKKRCDEKQQKAKGK